MLTPSQIENATQDIAEIYEQLHTEMLSKIAKSMKKNLSRESIEWQVNRAQEVGLLKADIIKMLDKSGQVAREEAVRIMEEAGIRGVAYDNEVYERAGLMDVAPKDYFMSPAMAQILATNLKRNADRLRNITQSTVQGSAEAFQQAMDLAYMQIASGAFTSQEAINNAVSKLADEGITVAQYASGRVIQMDSAVRMAVRTGINQTASTLQLERARELGSDLVEVTAHHGARPDHAVWQGKVYSLSGNHWRFPEFYSTTGYGTPSGLCGVNCRHNFSPYFEGLSEMAYSPNERAELRNETVTFTDATGNPRTVSRYEGEQRLRLIERNIRKYKRKSIVLESAGVDASFEKSKVREWQHKAKKFTDETGIKRKYFREKVDYKKKASTPPIPKVPKKPPTPTRTKLTSQPIKPRRAYNTDYEKYTEAWEEAKLKYKVDMEMYKAEKEKWVDEMLARPVPFKTHEEARNWFSSLGVETLGDFDEIDLRAFTDIKQAYEDMYTKYPALRYNAREFTVQTARKGTHIAEFNFGVHFNKGELTDYRAWLTSFDGMYNAGSSVYDIVVHELGHGLDDLFTFEKGRWDVKKMDMNHAFDPRKTVSKEMLKETIVENAVKGLSAEGITDKISDYATTNRGELFAEVITRKFESAYKKTSASDVVEAISEGVDDLLKTAEEWVDVEYLDAIAKVRRKNR